MTEKEERGLSIPWCTGQYTQDIPDFCWFATWISNLDPGKLAGTRETSFDIYIPRFLFVYGSNFRLCFSSLFYIFYPGYNDLTIHVRDDFHD